MSAGSPIDALKQLAARLEFYRDLGVYDFYQRGPRPLPGTAAVEFALLADPVTGSEQAVNAAPPSADPLGTHVEGQPIDKERAIARRLATPDNATSDRAVSELPVPPLVSFGPIVPAKQKLGALAAVRELIGDCTRCRLSQGRNKIVFGDGDPTARLMFVGEGPGADEDAQGLPFVGRAGQLLNNMINAMGLKREQVYIANIVKCRPPQNRKPEPDEAHTCTPFLERQIDVIRPQILVALGATAATYLLGSKGSIGGMRGRVHDYRGIQTVVTYHPAYLLRDPSQKKETWKDLQIAMAALGLKAPSRASQA